MSASGKKRIEGNGLYPSRRAVFAAAAGIPVAVAAGLIAPSLWLLGLVWSGLVLAAMLADVMPGANRPII